MRHIPGSNPGSGISNTVIRVTQLRARGLVWHMTPPLQGGSRRFKSFRVHFLRRRSSAWESARLKIGSSSVQIRAAALVGRHSAGVAQRSERWWVGCPQSVHHVFGSILLPSSHDEMRISIENGSLPMNNALSTEGRTREKRNCRQSRVRIPTLHYRDLLRTSYYSGSKENQGGFPAPSWAGRKPTLAAPHQFF